MAKVSLKDKIGDGYKEIWDFKGRYLAIKGGRGSKKSTTVAMKIICNMMKYPLANTLVVRQVFNTQRDSCFKQLMWATGNLGVAHLWKFTVSPLEATYLPTGQKIYFRGCDNPLSITSITVDKGVLNFVWFEEAYQIKNEDDFNKIDMSIRGVLPQGYFKQIILTFNPWSDKWWGKKRFFDAPNDENKLSVTTNYFCNEWLGEDDIKIYEDMKVKFPSRYNIEGLGNWGVSEGLIFDNWRVDSFDIDALGHLELWLGLDFGWQDPCALAVMRVDEENKKIYFVQELYKSLMTIEQVSQWIKDFGYHKSLIMCDSAEPRSIDSLKRNGINRATGCKKGAGSIMEGIRKLQEYEIIVHSSCVNAEIEFSNYAFDKDKFGNWVDKPIDAFCHLIDAARYGTQCANNRGQLKTISKSSFGF